jgi:cation diffusion facilitator family transporter
LQAHLDRAQRDRSLPAAAEHTRERRIHAVIGVTLVTMALEIGVGHWTGSMALIADGWHMATHAGALGLAAGAYALARRFAGHRAFVFGTGKVHALAGYTSALVLGFIAVDMMGEGVARLLAPQSIDFARSLPVAVLGLVVNLASVKLLHHGHAEPGHAEPGHAEPGHAEPGHAELGREEDVDPEADYHDHPLQLAGGGASEHSAHDHNHQAALAHVLADTCTSALAIGALLAGQLLGWSWLDPVSGLVGAAVVLAWGVSLCRSTSLELLNVDASAAASEQIRAALAQQQGVQITDLRVWPMGRGARGCVMTLSTAQPLDASEVRRLVLGACVLEHLTIEVRREPAACGAAAELSGSCN